MINKHDDHTSATCKLNVISDFRIVVSVQQEVSGLMLEEVSSGETSPDSLSDTCPMLKCEPSPFSSKPVMYDKEEVNVCIGFFREKMTTTRGYPCSELLPRNVRFLSDLTILSRQVASSSLPSSR